MMQNAIAGQVYDRARRAIEPSAATSPKGHNPIAKGAADFVSVIQEGEDAAKAAMTGQGDARSVVEALSRSELAVEVAVAIRDKVVEAYQEILRMPV